MFYFRNMFWPGRQLDISPRQQPSEQERIELKQHAVEVLKIFFPGQAAIWLDMLSVSLENFWNSLL